MYHAFSNFNYHSMLVGFFLHILEIKLLVRPFPNSENYFSVFNKSLAYMKINCTSSHKVGKQYIKYNKLD